MLLYQTLVLGDLQTNCYLVWSEETKECVVIDPADEGEFIADEINQRKLLPHYIVATHGHFDHVLGALVLKLVFNCPFACSNKDLFLLKRQKETARHFLGYKVEVPNFSTIDLDLNTTKHLKIGGGTIEIVKTPGHTPGGICMYSKESKLLFSGDTLFYGGVGRTDLSYACETELKKSLETLKRLPKDTLVLPGHGENCLLSVAF